MNYETCRQILQTRINEVITSWIKSLKEDGAKKWEAARQIDIVLKRISNTIRSKEFYKEAMKGRKVKNQLKK
jgi:hypothetical protein